MQPHTTRPPVVTGPPTHSADTSDLPTGIDEQIKQYRQRRRDRHKNECLPTRSRADREAEEIVRFAVIWAPFGGPPGMETFVQFGVTGREFVDKLRQSILQARCDPHVSRWLARVYEY